MHEHLRAHKSFLSYFLIFLSKNFQIKTIFIFIMCIKLTKFRRYLFFREALSYTFYWKFNKNVHCNVTLPFLYSILMQTQGRPTQGFAQCPSREGDGQINTRINVTRHVENLDLFFPIIHRMCINVLTHISLASHFWDICKQRRPRSDAAERGVWSGSSLFAHRNFYSK